MNEIVVISGKGGTGKTSLASAFAQIEGKKAVIADCDVDAANMHILMDADFAHSEEFYCGYTAVVNDSICNKCNICLEVCQFNAISDNYDIDELACTGCGYCATVCSPQAISMREAFTGNVFISSTKFGSSLVHTQMEIAAENSGKLVTKVKTDAKKIAEKNHCRILLVDSPPGIGCPVIASLSGASLALIVTEPTITGYNDMLRLYELITLCKIKPALLINKCDINELFMEKIEQFSIQKKIPVVAKIPYHLAFTEAMIQNKTILEYTQGEISESINNAWITIKNIDI